MRTALHAKFSQNKELAQALISTGNTLLVEASAHNKYWGAGCSLTDNTVWDPSKWSGKNTLGSMLCELRDNLRQ